MAFNPRSDVILEVMNAADPSKASLAAERLAAIAGGSLSPTDFAARLESLTPPSSPASVSGLANARAQLPPVGDASDPLSRAKVDFEAMLLNSFVSEMLPKDASAAFGQGLSGDMWRSMLSEQISRQIAKSGELGLARRLFGSRPMRAKGTEQVSPAAVTSANILSTSHTADVVGGAVLTATRRLA